MGTPASAQIGAAEPAQQESHRTSAVVKFLAGAALTFAAHESGHLVLDFAFDAKPRVTRVQFAGIPFFAISHRSDLSRRREFAISSAGFWTQESWNETLLTRRPQLRREHAPILTGALAFNIFASVAYAAAAFNRLGPVERDTRGMADAASLDERWIALLVLMPAVLDGVRYLQPDATWAAWTSRTAKLGSVALLARSPE